MDQIWFTEELKLKLLKQYETKIKKIDTASCIIGMFGLVFAFYDYELFYGNKKWDTEDSSNWTYEVEREQYKEEPVNIVLRLIVGLSSIALCVLIIWHYKIKLKLYKVK
jgi:hypothetical protein